MNAHMYTQHIQAHTHTHNTHLENKINSFFVYFIKQSSICSLQRTMYSKKNIYNILIFLTYDLYEKFTSYHVYHQVL